MDGLTILILVIIAMLVIAVAEAMRLIAIEIIEAIVMHKKRRRVRRR